MIRFTSPSLILVAAVLIAPAVAEDKVVVATQRGRTTLAGRIDDYNSRSLILTLADGRQQAIRVENVLAVETPHPPEQTQADAARAAGRFDEALALYQQALDAESRRWARRRILVDVVSCYRGLGRTVQAAETFLLLARDGLSDADYACIPLAWWPSQPSPELERAARQWIARDDLPAAELLGASHLLSIDRALSLTHLKRLMVHADGAAAQLAAAQAWRAEVVTATDATIAAWRDALERMPESLRPGPSYVVGRALARQGQWDEAALAMLEAPILTPDHRDLAAHALRDAGEALHQSDNPSAAARLYRELIERYAGSTPAVEAHQRWEELSGEHK